MKRVVIIGAGIAGLATAYKLLDKKNIEVCLLERSSGVGGLSRSILQNGFIYDLGPHQIHTQDRTVIDFLKKVLGNELLTREKKASQRFLKRYFNYPLELKDVVTGLPLNLSIGCFLSFCKQRVIMRFKQPTGDSFESWIVNHFGKKMYDIYFGPYTEKVWGVPPSTLAAFCAEQRVAVQSLLLVLLSTIFKNIKSFRKNVLLPHSPYQMIYYYPRKGIGELAEVMKKGILSKGGELHFNRQVVGIQKEGGAFKIDTSDGSSFAADSVVSTMPIDELQDMLIDENEKRHLPKGRLEYRSLLFLFLELDIDRLTDNHWIYFADRNCVFQRTSEFKNFSPATCPDGKTGICIEIPCNYRDPMWNMGAEDLYRLVIADAEAENFIKREWVVGYFVERERYAYPLFKLNYETELKKVTDRVNACENLFSIGRQGTFQYINIDDVLLMGFEAADKISG